MKRDLGLVLKILEYLEAREEITVIGRLQIPGYDDGVVAYHLRRMYEGGLLDAETITSGATPNRLINILPFGLTWEGHEFLDAMKHEGVAAKVRERLGGSLVELPFTVLKELALKYVREKLKLE